MPTDHTRRAPNYGWHNRPTMESFNGRVQTPAFRHDTSEVIRPDRVAMPLFEIASSPTISLAEIRNRRFNLVDRPPMPAAISQLLAIITEVGMVPEPIPEPHGPIRRRSRYEVLAAA